MEIIKLLQEPFFLRILLGSTIVAVMCAIFGIFVTLKKESFVSDAIAHASLAGVAFALMISFEPIVFALTVAILMSISITYLKNNSNISSDSIIGILFSMLFAIGILILSFSETYKPELQTYLFGSIVAITWMDIIYSFIFFAVAIILTTILYPKLVYTIFDPEAAYIRGIKVDQLEYLLNVLIAITIIISIKILGIVLVTALLITPATTAKLLARKFSDMVPLSILLSLTATLIGIFTSYYLDTPPGATIVIFASLIFFMTLLSKKIPHTK